MNGSYGNGPTMETLHEHMCAAVEMLNAHEGPADHDELVRLARLGAPFASALASMYAGEPQVTAAGQLVAIDETTRISVDEGLALYNAVIDSGTTRTLEVGLAYGFSAAYLLAGLAANGGGVHTAIDPFQASDWQGIGVTAAQRLIAGTSALTPDSLVLLEERSEDALPSLRRQGATFGVIFIDGYHRFDDVLVDVTLAAPMCPLGGLIVLHDMWLDSIAAVASFLRRNRVDFAEIDLDCENLYAMRRIGADERNWDHFVAFPMR